MSSDTDSQNGSSKKSTGLPIFSSPNANKTGLNNHENSGSPPEFKINEAAAKSKPIQVSDKKHDDAHDGHSAVNDDDPCKKKVPIIKTVETKKFRVTPGLDPRFQQQNQTLRCFVMYTDFYRCEKILGEGHDACTWFHDVFTSICPNAWIERWDEWRAEGRMPWSRERAQGKFPGDRYGV